MSTYAAAGVDIAEGDRAVRLLKEWVEKTRRPEVVGGIGGFAGLFDASALKAYKRPLLATSTDGVGTKVAIAQALDIHDTVGFDLVGMVVDDIVVCGAEPLFLTDYIACGKVVPERIAQIVKGIASACVEAGCALIGGEIAEHPGLLEPSEYDLAGAVTGAVEADSLLGAERVRAGDVAIAMASSGLHSNGYSLVRHVLRSAGWSLERSVPEFGRTLGEELLEPTRVYAKHCLTLASELEVHAFPHITGGGIVDNIVRVVPPGVEVVLDRSTWTLPPVFSVLSELGGVERAEFERTWNCGIGMLALVPADVADQAIAHLAERDVTAWVAGSVRTCDAERGQAQLVGDYR